ncbi:MAG TPA: hypothetical protein VH208_05725 [Myxococcaceae bacterium]|nr:hypothetical protein [Myxococcaceae bacterium]
MFGLTTIGIIHTLLGVVALICGFGSLARDKEISAATTLGRVYLVSTLLVAATALTLFRHGGFGPGHAFAIATLVCIAIGFAAERAHIFGGLSRYAMAAAYSATILFHLLPAFTEALTRLPPGAPIAASPEAPLLQKIFGGLGIAFLLGLALQLRWVRGRVKSTAAA